MPRQKTEPVVLADTSRLTFSERLEYQKLGIMADDLPTIYLNDRMEKAEYDSVLGLFLEKMSRRPKSELDGEVQARLANNQGWPKPGPEMTLFGVERRPVIDVNEEFELTIAHSYTLKRVIAKYLSVRLGVPVYSPSLLLQHPYHPYMLAKPDFIAVFPDLETGELNRLVNVKCKTATYWKLEELKNQIPVEHELLCRHEMAVADLDETILAYLCDNNEGGFVLYHLDRDRTAETKIIQCAKSFWNGYVEQGLLPIPTMPSDAAERDIALYAASRRRYRRPPDVIKRGMAELVAAYESQKEVCDQYKTAFEEAKEGLAQIEHQLSALMLDDAEGQCGDVKMRWTSRKTRSVDMDGLAAAYPDIYARFVTEKVRPGFEVKLKKPATKKEQEAA